MIIAPVYFEKQEAQRFASEFEELFNRGDYKAMASFYTEDARLMMENVEIVQGRANIEEFWQMACEMAGSMKHRTNVEEATSSGELAYTLGTITVEMQTGNDHPFISTLKYVTIWKRAMDGSWRLAVDMVNRNATLDQAMV